MKIDITEHNGAKVFSLSGDIDLYSSPVLRKELIFFIGKKVPLLLVDFRDVSYIDSSGIATLVEGLRGMMSHGGKLKLFGIPERIVEIFAFSKLDKVFDICGNLDDAVKD
ncbi:MAG: STAS domain-containing protein [Acidobacteriota bacterium]